MINRHKLKTLLGNNPDMVDRFIDMYKRQMPILLDRIKAGLDEENWEEVSIAAHDIKNQSSYLGLEKITKLATDLESLSDGERLNAPARQYFTKLEKLIDQVLNDDLEK